jgi:hypothetical protein
MEMVVLVILGIVVALVAIDALARLDERSSRRRPAASPRDENVISTQKIVVDLSKRT